MIDCVSVKVERKSKYSRNVLILEPLWNIASLHLVFTLAYDGTPQRVFFMPFKKDSRDKSSRRRKRKPPTTSPFTTTTPFWKRKQKHSGEGRGLHHIIIDHHQFWRDSFLFRKEGKSIGFNQSIDTRRTFMLMLFMKWRCLLGNPEFTRHISML